MFTRGIGFWPIPIYKKTRPDGLKKPLRRNVQTSQDNTSNMAPMATRCNPAGEETLARWLGKYSRDWSCRICRKCRKFSVEFLNCSRKHSIFEYFWYWSDSKSVAFRRKPWNVRGKAGIRARKMILSQLDDLHQLHLHCIQHCISYISLHHLHHIYISTAHTASTSSISTSSTSHASSTSATTTLSRSSTSTSSTSHPAPPK